MIFYSIPPIIAPNGIISVMIDYQWLMIKGVRIRKLFNPKTVNIRIL